MMVKTLIGNVRGPQGEQGPIASTYQHKIVFKNVYSSPDMTCYIKNNSSIPLTLDTLLSNSEFLRGISIVSENFCGVISTFYQGDPNIILVYSGVYYSPIQTAYEDEFDIRELTDTVTPLNWEE